LVELLIGLVPCCLLMLLAAGVTDEQLLAAQYSSSSGVKPHFVMDSFGDLRCVAKEAMQQQSTAAQ
jgi:hypothetical protein